MKFRQVDNLDLVIMLLILITVIALLVITISQNMRLYNLENEIDQLKSELESHYEFQWQLNRWFNDG